MKRAAFQTKGDACLNIFALCWPRHFDFPLGAKVLEIGCAEADWIGPMLQARPDLQIWGIDWRTCKRGAIETIQGDVLTHDFKPCFFDAVVLVSALEHIGLGHYDRDPLDAGGDTKTMWRIHRWLKPGGFVYFDVPWQPDKYEVCGTSHRTYDDAALSYRLADGFRTRWQGWTTHSDTEQLIAKPTTRAERFYYCANVWDRV